MRILTILLSLLVFVTGNIHAQSNEINATKFGLVADGVTDNSLALKKAFEYCIKNGMICYIPLATKPYLLKNTVYVDVPATGTLQIRSDGAILKYEHDSNFNNVLLWKLSPAFKERAMISIGPKAMGRVLDQAFTNELKNNLIIDGLKFEGKTLPFKGGVLANEETILSALDFSVDKVILKNLTFSNIMGYGLRSFGVKSLDIQGITIKNVGGRSKPDTFGDGIFISVVKKGASIHIDNASLEGALLKGIRSRSGITFEFSINPYRVKILNSSIKNYAKSLHFEEEAKADITVDQCTFSEFNYSIAMVANKESVCNIYNSTFNCSETDKMDRGDGGPTINTDNGGTYNFYNSLINLNGPNRAYITAVGINLFQNCTINGFNKNPYFADGSCTFDKCTFRNFGGSGYSFFSWGKNISNFTINHSKFIHSGPVNAIGQRVNLVLNSTSSNSTLTPQMFSK